jgi:hypothetical protein
LAKRDAFRPSSPAHFRLGDINSGCCAGHIHWIPY